MVGKSSTQEARGEWYQIRLEKARPHMLLGHLKNASLILEQGDAV